MNNRTEQPSTEHDGAHAPTWWMLSEQRFAEEADSLEGRLAAEGCRVAIERQVENAREDLAWIGVEDVVETVAAFKEAFADQPGVATLTLPQVEAAARRHLLFFDAIQETETPDEAFVNAALTRHLLQQTEE